MLHMSYFAFKHFEIALLLDPFYTNSIVMPFTGQAIL